AFICVVTALVVTVNFAVEDSEITGTELGTVAFALLLFSDTLVLLAAVPLKVTVHVADVGGVTLDGLQLKLHKIAGFSVTVNGFDTKPNVAVITACVCVFTALVVTVNFAVEDPEITVTELGTVAFALLLVSDTLVLLAAVPLKVTVHVADVGGVTLDGLQLKLHKIAGFSVT